MKILFVIDQYPNYVPDLLLHGLRKILGPDVIDYPKKECLYEGTLGLGICPEDQKRVNWFPPDTGNIDRNDILKKISNGYFDYIVCDVRAVDFLKDNLTNIPRGLVFIDGEDSPMKIKPSEVVICRRETDGSDFSIPLPMSLPKKFIIGLNRMMKRKRTTALVF